MKNSLNLFILLSITVLFTACPSSDESGKITHYFNEEIKTYVFMPVGSWWVYEDSTTNELDTVTIIFSEIKISDDEIDDYEYIDITYRSSYYNGDIWGGGNAIENSYMDTYLYHGYLYATNCFFSDSIDSILLLKGELVARHLDSLKIGDKIFTNVKKFTKTKHTYNLIPKVTYYAPHVGLIRKELFNGDVWNLKTYNINN